MTETTHTSGTPATDPTATDPTATGDRRSAGPGNGHSKPDFATNHAGRGERVADAINRLLAGVRTRWTANSVEVAIASAYFNPGGFGLLAEELEQAGRVRLLLGAEPMLAEDRPRVRPLSEPRRRRGPDPMVQRALEGHARSMVEDRDLLGFTREADASARRLVAWLREHPNVEVRRYEAGFLHGKAFIVETDCHGVLAGSSNFTYAGLAKNNELNLGRYDPHPVTQVVDWFNEQWDAAVPYDLAGLYEARWTAHQPWDVFLRMLYESYGADLDTDTRTDSALSLTQFQVDGVWRAKRILEARHGVLIADEVGLGKTFLAGELIHEAVFQRRQKVLIVAPATLRDSTWQPFLRSMNLRADVVSFEELVADIDIAGTQGSRLQALDEYAMVIVDEAHGLRSANTQRAEAMRRVLAGPVPKDLVLLTATPVNNSLEDLYNLIVYFTPNDAAFADVGISSLRGYFADAMALNPDELSPEHLFDVLDEVAVRRTRRFVKNHYVGDRVVIGGVEREIAFPTPRVHRVNYNLDAVLPGVFADLARALGADAEEDTTAAGAATGVITTEPGEVFTMARYVPSRFTRAGETEQYETQNAGLIRSMLLKRFESSSHAFGKTLEKMIESHENFLSALDHGKVLTGDALRDWVAADSADAEEFFDSLTDSEHVQDAADYDADALRAAVESDLDLLHRFRNRVSGVRASNDPKIAALVEELAQIAADADAEGITETGEQSKRDKRKTLLFTYYTATADYLHEALKVAIASDPRLAAFRGRHTVVSGADRGEVTNIITGFAPQTAGTGIEDDVYDLIVTTDVLAEGVNLQQARNIINYDLPWNPMRLVQRHGRIDRIGSPHREVFLRCFFPDADLDAILALEERLQRKLKQAAASIGAPRVLPGVDPVERNLTHTREQINQIIREEAALFEEGGGAALSGEEFRRRLAEAFRHGDTRHRVTGLPWGAGTGFTRATDTPGFVFCARIGDHDKPWFRYVPLNPDLTVQRGGDHDEPVVVEDTLAALDHADPRAETVPAHLTEDMYAAAFEAWAVARDHIHASWMHQADPANLQRQVQRVMREAADLVAQHGMFLGDRQEPLRARLAAEYPPRVKREVRAVLTSDADNRTKIERLADLADRHGMTPPPPPETLPVIDPDDIHLVCWTAITPADAESAAVGPASTDVGVERSLRT